MCVWGGGGGATRVSFFLGDNGEITADLRVLVSQLQLLRFGVMVPCPRTPRQWQGSDLRTRGTSRLLRDAQSQETEKVSLEIVCVQGERKTAHGVRDTGLSSETVAE